MSFGPEIDGDVAFEIGRLVEYSRGHDSLVGVSVRLTQDQVFQLVEDLTDLLME